MNKISRMVRLYMPYVIAILLVFSVANVPAFASDDVSAGDTADQAAVIDSPDEALNKDTDDELRSQAVYQYENADLKAVATLTDVQALSDQAKLTATKITNVSRGFHYEAYMKALNKNTSVVHDDHNTLLYDISFTLNGKEVEPEAGKVKLTVQFKKDQLSKDLNLSQASSLQVVHFKNNDADDREVLQNNTDVKNNQTTFTTDSLSVFAIENKNPVTDEKKAMYANVKIKSKVKKEAASSGKLYRKLSADSYDPGYGVIAENYYQTGDTESNVCVQNYYSTASEVGESSNYADGAGSMYIGNVLDGSTTTIRPHNAPANVYLGRQASAQYDAHAWSFDSGHIQGTKIHKNVTTIDPMSIIGDMCKPYVNVSDHGQAVYSRITNAQGQPDAENATIDLRNEADGTYIVTYNGDNIDASQYGNKWLNVYLNKGQHLVIYCTASSLTIHDYYLNGKSANSYVADTNESDDYLTKAVTFYAPNATTLSLPSGTCGVFLAPQATLFKDNTCAGIMAVKSAGTRTNPMKGEWHYHNHHLPSVMTETGSFKLTKKLGTGTSVSSDKTFTFKITLKNATNLVGNFGDADFHNEGDDCVAYVTLKANETKTISDLPVSTQYSIEENLSTADAKLFTPAYTIKKDGKDETFTAGTITKDVTDDVTCTNTSKTDDTELTIIKYVKGNLASTTKEFTFTITFDGHPDLTRAKVYFNDKVQGTKVQSGMTVALKDSDQLKITGLPKNIVYTVSEDAEGYTPSYVVNGESESQNKASTGTLTLKSATTLTFTNTRQGTVATGLNKQRLVMGPFIAALIGALIYTMHKRKE